MEVFIFTKICDYVNSKLIVRNVVFKKYDDCFKYFNEEYLRLRNDKNMKEFSGVSGLSSNGKNWLYCYSFYEINNMRNTIKLDMNEMELH